MFLFFFIQKKNKEKKYLPEVFRNEKENHHTIKISQNVKHTKPNHTKCEMDNEK